jgi:hypothetical protein
MERGGEISRRKGKPMGRGGTIELLVSAIAGVPTHYTVFMIYIKLGAFEPPKIGEGGTKEGERGTQGSRERKMKIKGMIRNLG